MEANTRGGAIDALVNYWITKINDSKSPESPAVPEWNLEMGAGPALERFLAGRQLHAATAFELGLHLANIVSHSPLDAEAEIFAAIEAAIRTSKEIQADRAEYEAQKA